MSAPLYALMVLVSWLVLGALLVGVARLVRRAFHWRSTDILGDVWVGYGATLAALQLWHLVAPIGPGAFVVFSIAGGAGLLLTGARPGRLRARLRGGAFALSFLLALVLALRALSVAAIYDTGLYHLSSVRWLMEAPIVPGLGNLHGRLAFNNSSFLWNALVKAGPWDALAIHVGQGTLLLPLIVRSGFGAARLIFRRGSPRPTHLFWPLVTPLLFLPAYGTPATFSPDHVMTLMSLEVVARLPACVRGVAHDRRLVAILAATLVVVKLSAVFAAAGCSLLLIATGSRGRARGEVVVAAIVGLALLAPWCARGVVLSGHPLFPSTVLRFDLDWSIDAQRAAQEALSIRSWARTEGVDQAALRDWAWLKPWLDKHKARPDFVVPLAFVGFALLTSRRRPRLTWPAHGPPLLAIATWFVMAPDVRFIHGFLWGWGALVAGEALCAPGARASAARFMTVASLLLAIYYWDRTTSAYQVSFEGPPSPSVEARKTNSGLVVYVPRHGDQTWDAPLPCAPSFDPALALRDPTDLRSGFVITRRRE